MLQHYKEKFLLSRTQFVLIDTEGTIINSDNVLFDFPYGSKIEEHHPFFISFEDILNQSSDKEIYFSCVQLDIEDRALITDITVQPFPHKEEVLVVIQDSTEHYNAYQKVAQRKNESVIKEELLTIKNLRLREKEEFRNQFIANFSHELRGPLTSILAFSDLLQKTELNNEQKEYVRLISAFGDHLRNMMDDILNINQINLNTFEIHEDFFHIKDLFRVLQETYKLKCQEKNLKFQFEYDEKIPEIVTGDKLRLTQIITNLLENSLKFTPSGSISLKIKLNQIRANTASIKFIVKDTGIGIPKDKQATIFDGFSQANKEFNHLGAGLGLALVKKILHLLNSEVKLDSAAGEGTKVSFNLTLKYPVSTSDKKKLASKEKETFVAPSFDFKHNVLLVEDDPMLQMLIFKLLIGTKNFYLDMVYSGEEALERVTEKGYDLILMDVKLPNIDGVETTKRIKEMPSRKIKTIPIIALTGVVFKEDLKTYKKSGFKDIIRKPFKEEEFLRIIYKYIK